MASSCRSLVNKCAVRCLSRKPQGGGQQKRIGGTPGGAAARGGGQASRPTGGVQKKGGGPQRQDKRGGGGRGKGRGGGRFGQRSGAGPISQKKKTKEELDAEMDAYFLKDEKTAAQKLNSDLDDYWKVKPAAEAAIEEGATAE